MITKKFIFEIDKKDRIKKGLIYYFFNNKKWIRITIKDGKYIKIFSDKNESKIKKNKINKVKFLKKNRILKEIYNFINEDGKSLKIIKDANFSNINKELNVYIYNENTPEIIEEILYEKVEKVYNENIEEYGQLWTNGLKDYDFNTKNGKRIDWEIELGNVVQDSINIIYKEDRKTINKKLLINAKKMLKVLISETLIETDSHFMFTSSFITESLFASDLSKNRIKDKMLYLKNIMNLTYNRDKSKKEETLELFNNFWKFFHAVSNGNIKDELKGDL